KNRVRGEGPHQHRYTKRRSPEPRGARTRTEEGVSGSSGGRSRFWTNRGGRRRMGFPRDRTRTKAHLEARLPIRFLSLRGRSIGPNPPPCKTSDLRRRFFLF